jgi:hypothetical protein
MTACVIAATGTCIPRMGPFGARFLNDLAGSAVGRFGEGKFHAGLGQHGNFVNTGDDECEVRQAGKMLSNKSAAVSQLPTHTYYFDVGRLYFAALRDPLEFGNKSPTTQRASWLVLAPSDSSFVCSRLITALRMRTCRRLDCVCSAKSAGDFT